MKKIQLLSIVLLAFLTGYAFHYVQSSNKNIAPKKVTGIGGIFFKCNNRDSVMNWYSKHLGINMEKYGGNFAWKHYDDSTKNGYTLWAPFNSKSKYFSKDFMINYRVENLHWLLDELKKENILPVDKIDSTSYGYFVHIMDLEGNKIELWEADDKEYKKIIKGITW